MIEIATPRQQVGAAKKSASHLRYGGTVAQWWVCLN
jgi:hypothetical protein